jgi:hypothetical protein
LSILDFLLLKATAIFSDIFFHHPSQINYCCTKSQQVRNYAQRVGYT